jgi:retron-type reverse transcriptase
LDDHRFSGGGDVDRIFHDYDFIISPENLLTAWYEFEKGKKNRKDVSEFSLQVMTEIFSLHEDLKNKKYKHGKYIAFKINDPKPRDIHKATVRDRLLHHAIFRVLYSYFDNRFITHSYSSRKNKGTHKALIAFKKMCNKVGKNNTKTIWVLKCDIKKFFASVDHNILKNILNKHIQNPDILELLYTIIDSFCVEIGKGLPLGNLTSQLLVNVYMNEFDQFVKHGIKAKHYIRYADDFVFLSQDKGCLEKLLPEVKSFLKTKLKLEIHPKKVSIKTIGSGVDFLGWVHFSYHRVLRTVTKKRMFRNLERKDYAKMSLQSYLGMLKRGDGFKLKNIIRQSVSSSNSSTP